MLPCLCCNFFGIVIQLDQTNEEMKEHHSIGRMALMGYKMCLERFGSPYQIDRAIADGRLFKMIAGVYSDNGSESEIEVLQYRYPESVITLGTAYYYYDLTDVIPDTYDFLTARNARRIQDERICQYYIPAALLKVGMVAKVFNGEHIRTYDLERLVIETARMKCSLPFDLYKEVILAFRRRADEIIPSKIDEYLDRFPKRNRIERIIDEEVF